MKLDRNDLVAAGSVCAIIWGVGLIYPPAAWIVGGALGLTASILVAKSNEGRRGDS
jgi:hypothetical protein